MELFALTFLVSTIFLLVKNWKLVDRIDLLENPEKEWLHQVSRPIQTRGRPRKEI